MMMMGMNRSVLWASLCFAGGLCLVSCQKPADEQAAEVEEPASATPALARTAPPPPPAAVPAATPVADPLAPPGVFYLLQKTSITTEDGIVGLRPGQPLREISPGNYQAGPHTVQLSPSVVTNNLRIARQFAHADAASQAALRQATQTTPTPAAATPRPRIAKEAPRSAAPRPAAPSSNPLSAGPKLGGGTGVADPETSNRRNVRVDNSGRQYWRDSRGAIRYDF